MLPAKIVDTHLHLWDPRRISYPWLNSNRLLNKTYLIDDYRVATQGIPVEAMVFVQCEANFSAFREEAAWVADVAKDEPRIKGLVAWAPLEEGRAVRADLESLSRHAILRGIRRIIQFEPDLAFCLQPGFIEGLKTLKEFNLSFDICIDHRHMANALELVEQVPDISMILDHIGKPNIRDSVMYPWADQLRVLAKFPNVTCKISGVATEADHRNWSRAQLKPYIEVALEAFGFDRVMFGGDWPVSTQAIGFGQWIEVLDDILRGVSDQDRQNFWSENAKRVYRL